MLRVGSIFLCRRGGLLAPNSILRFRSKLAIGSRKEKKMSRIKPINQSVAMRARHRAQGILEYVSLLAVVGAALITMQLYFKMGIQAGIRGFSDYIGSQKKGTAEDDFDWLWFTNGVKGVQSVSETFSEDFSKLDTKLDKAHYVNYNGTQTGSTIGLARWSVGIERATVGKFPSSVPVDDGSSPGEGAGTGAGTDAGTGAGTGKLPPKGKTCPPKESLGFWLGWHLFWNHALNLGGAFLKPYIESQLPWLLADEYSWLLENDYQGLYDWVYNGICSPPG